MSRRAFIGATLIFWSLASLALVMLAMQFGVWQREVRLAGPFAAETVPATRALTLSVPVEHAVPWWRQPLIGDSVEKPFESRLRLKINGISVRPAHTLHVSIRTGTSEGFSHWGSRLIFSLPAGVENAATTTAVLRYAVEPRPWVTLVSLLAAGLLGFSLHREKLRRFWRSDAVRRQVSTVAAATTQAIYLVLFGLCCFGLIGAAILLISTAYAFTLGWALPTTAIIRWWPVAHWAATNEPYLPYLLIALAGLGTTTAWLTAWDRTRQPQFKRSEARVQGILRWAGFPIAMSAFVVCLSAMWSGQARPGDLELSAIGGLLPFNDAFGYLAAMYDEARDGNFGDFAMRRPYGASLRSVLLFVSHYSLPGMLLLQACLLGAAAWWASCAVMAWRGVWAGLAFFGLAYIYARVFAPTTLTEPLGLFWALLSVPFFIASFRTSSVYPALIGFALTVCALMTRMGNMFAIPALMLWLVWQFGRGVAAKVRIALFSIGILLAALGFNSLVQKAYGTGIGSTGDNFSYVICGLTIGTTWEGCYKKLEEARGPDEPALSEQARVRQMYLMAWDNFRKHPEVLFQRLGQGTQEFYSQFSQTIWKGYLISVEEPGWFSRRALVVLILIGLGFVATQRANSIELSFWALFCASITVSAAIIFMDDGNRTLAASHPLVALLLATGFTNPSIEQPSVPNVRRLTRCGALGLLLAGILMATIPWIAHRFFFPAAVAAGTSPLRKEDVLVYGGRRMSGFLVVADGMPLRGDIPTVHISSFAEIMARSYIETLYQGLLDPVAPPLPFGFVFAPRVEGGVGSHSLYIVPAEVMERRDVPAWRFKTELWNHKKDVTGNFWVNVTAATPLTLKEQ